VIQGAVSVIQGAVSMIQGAFCPESVGKPDY
jgi:hypothetical protein